MSHRIKLYVYVIYLYTHTYIRTYIYVSQLDASCVRYRFELIFGIVVRLSLETFNSYVSCDMDLTDTYIHMYTVDMR